MRWLHRDLAYWSRQAPPYRSRHFSIATARKACHHVPSLKDWNVDTFRDKAFTPGLPVLLPLNLSSLPPACQRWFSDTDPTRSPASPSHPPSLNPTFWTRHASTLVPLELTTVDLATNEITFARSTAPLQAFLDFHNQPPDPRYSLYLAQCPLSSLPTAFQSDLPTPQVVHEAGKGDVYDTNLWIGRAPTYTPLHRDPNPNLFMQLAGSKVVRLLPPEVGRAVLAAVQEEVGGKRSSVFRGEEMMQGREREVLERVVWGVGDAPNGLADVGYEAKVASGEALFIPKGWWHSIKGVGEGITASVNWWFR